MEKIFDEEALSRRDAIDVATGGQARFVYSVLMGTRAQGETPKTVNQIARTALSFGTFFAGIASSTLALAVGGAFAAPLVAAGVTMTVAGARDLQLTILHHSAHGTVISPAVSERLGGLIGTLIYIEPFASYAPRHRSEHHGRQTVSTELDPTVAFLIELMGIKPGAKVAVNKKAFWRALRSLPTHARIFAKRSVAHFGKDASLTNKLATAGVQGAIAAGFVSAFGVVPYLVAFVLPLTIGYQVAAMARLVVEHLWPAARPDDGKRTGPEHDALTVAVRLAPDLPKTWTFKSRAKFALSTLGHLFVRFVVLPGDSGPNHGWHHGQAKGDWANHIDASDAYELARFAKGQAPTAVAYSYGEALQMALESFEAASIDSLRAPEVLRKRRAAS